MGSKDGVALIMVLWAIVILSFLLISLTEEIQLESYLTRNLMDQTQLQYIAQAGIARGLAELKGDQTLADGKNEKWLMPIRAGIEGRGNFEVKIEDIGSVFNINYIGFPVIDYLIPGYVDEFREWRVENFPYFMVDDVEQFPNSEEITNFAGSLTFYGKFNVNTDDLDVLKGIMIKKGIAEWIAERVVSEMEQIQEPLDSLDELLLHVPSMDMATFNIIKDELTVKGNININLVDAQTLYTLMDSLKIHRDLAVMILEYREKETITDLRVFERQVGEGLLKKISPYFDVSSKYFRITCVAKSSTTSLRKTIVVEIERLAEKVSRDRVMEWSTKILSWVES